MTTNCTIIRILEGIIFRINDTNTLATDKTTKTEIAITMAGFNWTVIASAEQIPNT